MGRQYTIKDLEKETGIPPRTIHFYIKEKLIPPAIGAGGGASYGEEHILKLKLIKEMKNSHLKLSGIKQALDGMTVEEMSELYLKTKKGRVSWNSNSLENWMNDSMSGQERQIESYTIRNQGYDSGFTEDYNYLQNLKRKALPDSSWKRFYVIDGIEINIRSDLMEKFEDKIMWYIDILRKEV